MAKAGQGEGWNWYGLVPLLIAGLTLYRCVGLGSGASGGSGGGGEANDPDLRFCRQVLQARAALLTRIAGQPEGTRTVADASRAFALDIEAAALDLRRIPTKGVSPRLAAWADRHIRALDGAAEAWGALAVTESGDYLDRKLVEGFLRTLAGDPLGVILEEGRRHDAILTRLDRSIKDADRTWAEFVGLYNGVAPPGRRIERTNTDNKGTQR